MTTTPTFTFDHRPDAAPPLVSTLPPPGDADFWELYLGTTFTQGPRTVTIDNVACEACR